MVLPIILIVLLFVGVMVFKRYSRNKAIGKAQEKTKDLKAQQELKDINEYNNNLEQQLKGKEDE